MKIDNLINNLRNLENTESTKKIQLKFNEYETVLTEDGEDNVLTEVYKMDMEDLVMAVENYMSDGIGCQDNDTVIFEHGSFIKLSSIIRFIQDWWYENKEIYN